MESEKFIYRSKGLSFDLRTNVWNFVCKKCKKEFSPQTTMMAIQNVVCPKCNESEIINYNK